MLITQNVIFSIFLCFCVSLICWAQEKQIICTVEKAHTFSSPDHEDIFQLILNGRDTLGGTIYFQIISHGGGILYREKFNSIDLIGYGLMETDEHKVSRKEQCDYIIKRMNSFFDKQNFKIPAISDSDSYDGSFTSKEIWREIKSSTSAVGFYYLIGEENNRQIVYSKKSKKVVVYKSYD